MENVVLTPEQIEKIRLKKLQGFKSAGLPANAGQMINVPENYIEQAVQQRSSLYEQQDAPQPVQNFGTVQGDIAEQVRNEVEQIRAQRMSYGAHATPEKIRALEEIRRGFKKDTFQVFVEKEKKSGAAGYQIPVKRPNNKYLEQMRPKPSIDVKVQEASATPYTDGKVLEDMFVDNSRSFAPSTNMRTLEESGEVDLSGLPPFDPMSIVRKKAPLYTPPTRNVNENYSNVNLGDIQTLVESIVKNSTPNIELIKEMITVIAKDVAKKTIKEVIEEYAESQKKKNTYEIYNKEKAIVKIDDKLYHLQPVIVKRREV